MRPVPPAKGLEREPRPDSHPLIDLGRRELYIKRGSIKPWMLSTRRMEYCKYGTGKYGRCLYGVRPGIYGSDRYGSCSYY